MDAYLGRSPIRRGYTYVVWRGRHVAESTELSPEETAGFWSEVARVSRAVESRYQPARMTWLHLGTGVPHLHIHLVPRPADDPRAGGPIETEAFDHDQQQPLTEAEVDDEATAIRAAIAQGPP
ncbi:MAG: HIT family protein [Acidimicrobiales bacterium]